MLQYLLKECVDSALIDAGKEFVVLESLSLIEDLSQSLSDQAGIVWVRKAADEQVPYVGMNQSELLQGIAFIVDL